MWLISLFLGLVLAGSSLAIAAEQQEVDIPSVQRELNEVLEKTESFQDEFYALRGLAPEKRARLIEFTRKQRQSQIEQSGSGGDDYLIRLYFLGDMAARDQLVKNYYRNKGQGGIQYHIFRATGDPELVPMLVPALLTPEPYQRFGTDGFSYPLSFNAAQAILAILGNARVFNRDVTEWAHSFDERVPSEESRSIVREWWSTNEKFIRDKNYKAVRPGKPRRL